MISQIELLVAVFDSTLLGSVQPGETQPGEASLGAAVLPELMRTCLIMLCGLALVLVVRRWSAATARFVIVLTCLCTLTLPVTSLLVPAWRVLPMTGSATVERDRAVPDPVAVSIDDQQIALLRDREARSNAHSSIGTAGPTDTHESTSQPPATSVAMRQDASPPDHATEAASLDDQQSVASTAPPRFVRALSGAVLSGLWAVGFVAVMLYALVSLFRLRALARRSIVCADDACMREFDACRALIGLRRRPRLLLNNDDVMPMTWGVVSPIVLLPASATGWSPQRLRAVLLHELAHVRQSDLLWRLVIQINTALHWFNPVAWMLRRRFHHACELAADDIVLRSGHEACDYAQHLLETVRRCAATTPLGAMAIARPKQFESRIASILDASLQRAGLTRRHKWIASTCAAAVTVLVAAVSPVAPVEETKELKSVETSEETESDRSDLGTRKRTIPVSLGSNTAQDIISPPIEDDDLSEYVELLTLSDGQFKAIEPIYQEYLTEWRAWEEEAVAPMSPQNGTYSREYTAMSQQQRLAYVQSLHEQCARFDAKFFDRLPRLLTDEQSDRLQLIRELRERDRIVARCHTLGMVSYRDRELDNGIGTDLRRLSRTAGITASERRAIEPLLAEYERTLMQRLRAYDEAVLKRRWLSPAGQSPEEVADADVEVGAKALQIHRRYMKMMLPHLAPQRVEAFEREVNGKVLHRIEPDRRRVHRYIEHIRWDSLTPVQTDAVNTLRAEYEPQHRELSERIWRLFDDAADDGRFWMRRYEDPHKNVRPMRRLIEQRDALNVATRDRLRQILGDDSVQKIVAAIGWLPDSWDISSVLSVSREYVRPEVRLDPRSTMINTSLTGRSHLIQLWENYLTFECINYWYDDYQKILECNAAQSAAMIAAAEQLNEKINGLATRLKWLNEREGSQWNTSEDNEPVLPTRAQIRDNVREREAIFDAVRTADKEFLAAIEQSLNPDQLGAMEIVREMHIHWRYFHREPNARVGEFVALDFVDHEIADIRRLFIRANVSAEGWELAEPALATYRPASIRLVHEQRDAIWRVRQAAELAIIENITRDGERFAVDLTPSTKHGEAMRAAMADFRKAHDEHVELHERARASLKELLPESDWQQFEILYMRMIAQQGLSGDPAGLARVRKAMQLDDLSTQQRDDLFALHTDLIELDDALTKKMAEMRVRVRFGAGGIHGAMGTFGRDGTFSRVPPSQSTAGAATAFRGLQNQKKELGVTMLRRLRHILDDDQERAIGLEEIR